MSRVDWELGEWAIFLSPETHPRCGLVVEMDAEKLTTSSSPAGPGLGTRIASSSRRSWSRRWGVHEIQTARD